MRAITDGDAAIAMIFLLTDLQALGVALIGFAVAVLIVGVVAGLVTGMLMKRPGRGGRAG